MVGFLKVFGKLFQVTLQQYSSVVSHETGEGNLSSTIRYAHPLPQIKILPGISVAGNGRQGFSGCFALDPTVRLFNTPIYNPALKWPQWS